MKARVLIHLIVVLFIFNGCNTDSNLTISNFVGIWQGENGKTFTGGINKDSIWRGITEINFLENNTYQISSPGVSNIIDIFSEPKTSGSWEFNEELNRIRLYGEPVGDFMNDVDNYYWQIEDMKGDTMVVSVLDKTEKFIRKRSFYKIK